LSQFSTKGRNNETNDGDDSTGDTLPFDGMDKDEMDDKDLKAAKEMDKDHQASDEAEKQDLAQDVDEDI
jgi:hypothetical protein